MSDFLYVMMDEIHQKDPDVVYTADTMFNSGKPNVFGMTATWGNDLRTHSDHKTVKKFSVEMERDHINVCGMAIPKNIFGEAKNT